VYQSLYDYSVFEKINNHDIEQGQLGDCYFLSVLSALAEDPERVKKILVTHKINYAGCYAVNLFVNGECK
jgi:calpain-15